MSCGMAGLALGVLTSVVGLVFGIFACVPAGPYESRNLDVCVSFIVLSALGVVTLMAGVIGVCLGAAVDKATDIV